MISDLVESKDSLMLLVLGTDWTQPIQRFYVLVGNTKIGDYKTLTNNNVVLFRLVRILWEED